jgi:hypothetical protein
LGIFRAKNPVFLTEIRCFGLEILFAPDGTLSVGDPSHPATSDGHGSKDYFQPLFLGRAEALWVLMEIVYSIFICMIVGMIASMIDGIG